MSTPASLSILAAARDNDILNRLVALAATRGLTQAQVEEARMRLASAKVDSSGATIASVYEFRVSQIPQYRPGEDPSAVTDQHLLYALEQEFGSEEST